MYESVSFTLTVLALLNLLMAGGFTVGSSTICPKNLNSTLQCNDNHYWDTISEMITRDDRVRNGFAAFLVISAVLIFFITSLILNRLDFYYKEIDAIATAAAKTDSFAQFKEELKKSQGLCTTHLLKRMNADNYDKNSIMLSGALSLPHSTYAFWSPLAYYESKKKAAWFSYAAAMICYIGFGIYSTDVNTEIHTGLAKGAFVLLMVLTVFLAHLSWNHMVRHHIGQIFAILSISGSIVSALMYAVTEVYWWEYVLVICLHVCILSLCKFDINFVFNNVHVRHYAGGDYRVDLSGLQVSALNLRL